ncbi:P-loop containing nucleoside triphosphate hydrolase protein [Entophlyctis helioformis]|nr:P-loop containing nucleoside triphosphate hydrolase protein [Entophlyctis helioformis]
MEGDENDAADSGAASGSRPSFRPPSTFIQASLARQAKIKQLQEQRSSTSQADDQSDPGDRQTPPESPSAAQMSHSQKSARGKQQMLQYQQPSSAQPQPQPQPQQNNQQRGSSQSLRASLAISGTEAPSVSVPSPQPVSSSANLKSGYTSANASKAVLEVERLRIKRLERRERQNEMRKAKEGLDDQQQKVMGYRQTIDDFRLDFARKRAELKIRLASQGRPERKRSAKIQVCVRKRPIHNKEINKKEFDIVTTATESYPYSHIYIHEPKIRLDLTHSINTHRFIFDSVFDENATNHDVYTETAAGLIRNLFTGSGKTHTIFGARGAPGVYEYACRDIFTYLMSPAIVAKQLVLNVSFIEIYGGRIYDLFSDKRKVQLLEDSKGFVQLLGHTEYQVDRFEDMMGLVKLGADLRTTGTTEANSQSSRSHAIIQMHLRNPNGTLFGKFSLVDLAGSERGADTGNISRQARHEGSEINKSLLALKECIRALHKQGKADGSSAHIPFRASKLTQILRDSFIGKRSQTAMIAMISPGSSSAEHSLNTLRYADRVKEFRRGQTAAGTMPNGDAVDLSATMAEDALSSPTESHVDSPEFDVDLDDDLDDDPDELDSHDADDTRPEYAQLDEVDAGSDFTGKDSPGQGTPRRHDSDAEYASEGLITDDITDDYDRDSVVSSSTNNSSAHIARSRAKASPKPKSSLGSQPREQPRPKSSRGPVVDRAAFESNSPLAEHSLSRLPQAKVVSSSTSAKASPSLQQHQSPVASPRMARVASKTRASKIKAAASSSSSASGGRSTKSKSVSRSANRPPALSVEYAQETHRDSDLEYPSSIDSPAVTTDYNNQSDAFSPSTDIHHDYGAAYDPDPQDTIDIPPEQLFEEEEDLVNKHLSCVTRNGLLARHERMLLANSSHDGRDIYAYIAGLEKVTAERIEMWTDLQETLQTFKSHLQQASNGRQTDRRHGRNLRIS